MWNGGRDKYLKKSGFCYGIFLNIDKKKFFGKIFKIYRLLFVVDDID